MVVVHVEGRVFFQESAGREVKEVHVSMVLSSGWVSSKMWGWNELLLLLLE